MMLTPEQLAELRAAIKDDERKFQGAYVTYPVSLKFMQDMMDTIDALQARIAELEQDAARYRWLRDHQDPESIEGPARDMARVMLIDGRKTDEAIDAAMQSIQQNNASNKGE